MASATAQADGIDRRSRRGFCRRFAGRRCQGGKHKKHVAAHTAPVTANSRYRGANLFPAGSVHHANDYLGDDPDPFIRLQLQRDIGAHYGGEP